ncbi:MAG: hypothetical protein A3E84_02510 [Gammaproteobacteria bacterium RIFCSPHIGHO2_12_FULL_42_13]|nr:MAG: hypothetical protein A3E84_02510 [Gammaproteobacteria bacterium RIFCSPHIGHO2_12_FULL_42_13]
MEIRQYHGLTSKVLAQILSLKQESVTALNSGLVRTLLGSTQPQQQPKQFPVMDVHVTTVNCKQAL